MLPSPERLEEIASLTTGSLKEVPFSVLLTALAVKQRTLLLEMRRGAIEKKIVLDSGIPVDCRSNLAHETLGRYMVSLGKLREEDFQASLARSAAKGVPLGQVLLEQELITSFELFRILQQNLAKKLLDCFGWHDGEFATSTSDMSAVDSTLKVKPAQLIITGVMKSASQDEVNAAIVPLISKKLGLNPVPPFSFDDVRFSAVQSKLIERLGQRARIDELVADVDMDYDEMSRFVYAMAIVRFVLTEDQLPKATGAPMIPIRKKEAAPRTIEQPLAALTLEDEILRNDVMQAYLSFRSKDAFDLFGLDESANDPQIREGYLAFAAKCAPWRFEQPTLLALKEKAEEVFLFAARAFAELSSSEQRMTLIHRRRTLREEQKRSTYANRFAIKTDLLDSEVQFKKGRALLEAGKTREALQLLEFAADCDPQNATYAAEVAWCKFLLSPTFGREALTKLDEAMRLEPENGIAAFYAGEINRQMGNAAQAEPLLRKACKLMAPDRRPVEALKALLTKR